MNSLWNPFSYMSSIEESRFVVTRGEGAYVFDDAGRRYLDGTAALWFANVGYGRTEIVDAVTAQMQALPAYHLFGGYVTQPSMDAADRIAALAPVADSKVFFGSGGSDAVDTAAKLVRRYHQLTGQPERRVIISRVFGYHGMHGYGTSLAGIQANADGYGELIPDVVKVDWSSVDALEDAIETVGAHRVAGMISEPVIGAGGVYAAPPGYLGKTRQIISDVGGLYIADEVITGFGRVGDWFASNRFDLKPDLVTFAKGVTSGYQPLGGVIVSPRVAEPFWEEGVMWRHGYTYSGHAAACAAALANIAIMEREHLPQRALELETTLESGLETLLDHPLVDHVRAGTGVMAALALVGTGEDPTIPARASLAIRRAGVIVRPLGDGVVMSPPLIVTDGQIDELVNGIRAGLDELSA